MKIKYSYFYNEAVQFLNYTLKIVICQRYIPIFQYFFVCFLFLFFSVL